MKEHPDYKYRPRRKPKNLVKKENKFGFSISPLMSPGDTLGNISRGLLPPLAPPSHHHPLIGHDDLKIPRFFPPFPYPLYPIQHKLGDELNGGKLAADLAFQALYGGSTFYSSHQAVSWPGLPATTCLQANCGCPSPPKDPKRTYLPSKLEERPFPSPGKHEEETFPIERDTTIEESRYRKLEDEGLTSTLERHQEERSRDRFSSSSSSSPTDRPERASSTTSATTTSTVTKVESVFSVQNLTSPSTNLTSHRSHVIWRPLPVLPDLNFRGNLLPTGWPTATDWWRIPPMLSPIPQASVANLPSANVKDDDVHFQEEHQRNSVVSRTTGRTGLHVGAAQWDIIENYH